MATSSLTAFSTCSTKAGSGVTSAYFLGRVRCLAGGTVRTAATRSRVDSREESLGGGDASFEFLHDLREGVSDLGFFFDLGFEIAEDGWVEEA